MDLQLKNKTALVTGATAGIGLEIARRLSVEGADVIICGRSQAKLDASVADIGVTSPIRLHNGEAQRGVQWAVIRRASYRRSWALRLGSNVFDGGSLRY
jgi:NAD(P)-dependent dehydrogenase (short-subunit alcohol dehydrogenase family)